MPNEPPTSLWSKCSFCRQCWIVLKHLLRVMDDLSNVQALFWRALYYILVRDDLIDELGPTKQEACSIWPWTPRLKCLSNDETSLTWLVICRAAEGLSRMFMQFFSYHLRIIFYFQFKILSWFASFQTYVFAAMFFTSFEFYDTFCNDNFSFVYHSKLYQMVSNDYVLQIFHFISYIQHW